MSWLQRLYQTYEQGLEISNELPQEQQLMPISHTIQNAHIHIILNGHSEFLRAEVLPAKTQIVLPATEQSAGRASGLAAHPMADKIQYIAADYADFGGLKKSGFEHYKAILKCWCDSSFSHASAKVIYQYIVMGKVVQDLVNADVLTVQDGKLLTQWNEDNEAPAILKLLPKEKGKCDQGSALVCWSIEEKGTNHSKTWTDKSLQQSWVNFEAANGGDSGLCLIKGKVDQIATNHPAKIRHSGDKAKLVSANDSSGFTFRGKFLNKFEAASIGFDATQKAHNALRWLISRQHFRNGEQVFISWAMSAKKIPDPMADPFDLLTSPVIDHGIDIGQQYGRQLSAYMKGYQKNNQIEANEAVSIIGLDSATPGRMGIIYYRETIAQSFFDTLNKWYDDLAWPQRKKVEFESETGKKSSRTIWPECTPAPFKICKAVYGETVSDSLKKNIIERLVPCIVEGKTLPIDIVNYAVKRACNRMAYKSDETWLWEQNLGIACALYKGFCKRTTQTQHKKEYSVALDIDTTSRDYLFGRLLAQAEKIEEFAHFVAGVKPRATSAARLMQRFSDRPYSTWLTIYKQLDPYMNQLKVSRAGFMVNRNKEIDEIMAKFENEDFCNNKKLSGEFLLGFHCQRLDLNRKKEKTESQEQTA
ncbi:MAG: type I-C CRISPR-associated protein Cas8c/Csd1 [Alteromonadales bacterium]|nr:type I-C CRISPR-associated protein Cas8c/Csd1 [Alteromonadales bacterium]